MGLTAEIRRISSDGETAMIDTAFKTHREVPFGWVLAIKWLWDALKARRKADRDIRIVGPR